MSGKGSKIATRWRVRRLLLAGLLCVMSSFSQSRPATVVPDSQPAWRDASPGYEFNFPRDHAAHPDNRIEWWYYTGNLETKTGRRFGYQLTFFRVGVVREPASASRWALRDLYMAHFAISDSEQRLFRSFERINRAGVGWAGADAIDDRASGEEATRVKSAVRVWNEDWETRIENRGHTLHAVEEDWSVDLKLAPSKPEVIHGENGISPKASSPGNASHYYSLTRLESSGRLVVNGEAFDVVGLSWMDHEFGSSVLDDEQIGWDWFSLQLEDGRDLMLFEIRRRDGSIDQHSSGTLIEAGGHAIHLTHDDFSLTPGRIWRSPDSGASYPITWTLESSRYALRLEVTASFENQELSTPESTGVTYWEGSVSTDGSSGEKRASGRGYLEMTGYSGQSMGAILR